MTGPARTCRWLAGPLPADVEDNLNRLARADNVVHVAAIPNVHLGTEVCVGTVVATTRLIYPGAIGGDIGCGMAAKCGCATRPATGRRQSRSARPRRCCAGSTARCPRPSTRGRPGSSGCRPRCAIGRSAPPRSRPASGATARSSSARSAAATTSSSCRSTTTAIAG